MVHATAIIHPRARLDPTVQVGPWVVIDEGVSIGPYCVLGPHVYLTGQTLIGSHNAFHAGCVIGDAPQDLKYQGAPTGLRIGDHNVFREHVTIHRSNQEGTETVIGSHNFLMANSHVAHNVELANHVILANGALLAGHVQVQDRAFISGNCVVHQFVRLGTLSFMQGLAAIGKDLPPYTVATGVNGLCGLNMVGLRRAGLSPEERLELKKVYRLVFRGRQPFLQALAQARAQFHLPPSKILLDFVGQSARGILSHTGGSERPDENGDPSGDD